MKKMRKAYRSLLLIVVLLFSMLFSACGHKPEEQTAESSTVSFSVVYPEDEEDGGETVQKPEETKPEEPEEVKEPAEEPEAGQEYVSYYFRNKKLLNSHYEKHGIEMGFASPEEYEAAASDVINNPEALHKTEKEDGDFCFYVEATNEFVILSQDGYIRTYFLPDAGIKYYNRQ